MNLNLVDLLLAAILLLGALSGWMRGFVFSALDLVTLVASLVLAFLGYRFPADWALAILPQVGVWAAPLSFVLLFFLVHLLLGALAVRLAAVLPRDFHANSFNRFLGLAPGLANGAVHAVVTAVVLLSVPLGVVSAWARDSALAGRLSAPAEWVEVQLAPVFDPAIRRTMQALTVPPQSHTTIPLRGKVDKAPPRPELEARMLELVNAARAKAGLKPLRADPELTAVARAHSRDMFARGYFSHFSPEGHDLNDRMRAVGLGYVTAGENLALAPTLEGAHQGLMRSPGHRANILRPQFGRVGIGVLDGGVHGLMVTENFRN